MKKFVVITGDEELTSKLNSVFKPKDIAFCKSSECAMGLDHAQLVLVDGDGLASRSIQTKLKTFKRQNVPVVFVFTELGGQEAIDILEKGAVAVLFKSYSGAKIRRKLSEILYNFDYLENVKELAENDAKTKKFLDVVKTLTSDHDINHIIVTILNAMKEVFQLESIMFFIMTHNRLKQKIALGKVETEFPEVEWEEGKAETKWLDDLHHCSQPIRVTGATEQSYKHYFREHTLLFPLTIKGHFFGLIAASSPAESRSLSKNEISLLTAFSEQAAVALENAQLYRDVIKAREKLVKQEKKTLLGQIAVSLNHEINNPLSIISMEAQLLQQRAANKEGKMEARLHNIENNIERIKTILETISSLNIEEHIATDYINGKQMLNLI